MSAPAGVIPGIAGAPPARAAAPAAASAAAGASRLVPFLVFAATLAAAVLTLGPWPVGVFQDDGIYVVLGKSLATGQGYRYLNIPGHPAATHYPPGYPALLALLWTLAPVFPDNVIVFKAVNALLLACAAVGAYLFGRRRLALGAPSATLAAVASSACVPALILAGIVLSEPLFLALLFPTLWRCERACDDDATVRDALGAGALAAALTLVRTLGLVVLPAATFVLLRRRRWRHAAALAIAGLVLLAPWQAWVALHDADVPSVLLGKYGSYTGWLAAGWRAGGLPFALAVLRRNLIGVADLASILTSASALPWLGLRAAAVVATGLVLAAGAWRWWTRAPVATLFLAGYGAIVLVWPFAPDRFLWGVWPLLGLLVASGVAAIAHRRPRTAPAALARAALLGAAVCVLVGYASYNVRGFRGHWYDAIQRKAAERARPLVQWVARYTRPADVLVTDDDVLMYLYTGRPAVPNATFTPEEHLGPQPRPVSLAALQGLVAAFRPRYVLVSTSVPAEAALALTRGSPAVLTFLGALPRGAVFAPTTR